MRGTTPAAPEPLRRRAEVFSARSRSLCFECYKDERAGTLAVSFGYLGLLVAPVTLIAFPLLGEGWHPLGLLGGVALFAVVLTQLISTILEGTRARGQATTRALLQAIWLVDLGSLLARGPLPLLGAWALLFVLGKAGAKLLFKPPPKPRVEADASGGETSTASSSRSRTTCTQSWRTSSAAGWRRPRPSTRSSSCWSSGGSWAGRSTHRLQTRACLRSCLQST